MITKHEFEQADIDHTYPYLNVYSQRVNAYLHIQIILQTIVTVTACLLALFFLMFLISYDRTLAMQKKRAKICFFRKKIRIT